MAIITWLHLSDWHQGRSDYDRTVVRKALLRDIESRRRISPDLENLDFIFFTGDLANHGKREEYESLWSELLEPVLANTAVAKERLFVIPGNHDIDRSDFVMLPEILTRPFADEEVVKDWLTNDRKRAKLIEPFAAYTDFVRDHGLAGFAAFGGSALIPVGSLSIGVLGCNSALMCGRNVVNGKTQDLGYLTIGESQISTLLERIEGADLRIALIHHPFSWLQRFDSDITETRIKRDCHIILSGHEHQGRIECVTGSQGNYLHIPAGASYDRRKPSAPIYVNSYNFVRYDTESGLGIAYLRCLNRHGDTWISDYERHKDGQYPFVLPAASIAPSNVTTAIDTTVVSDSESLPASKTGMDSETLYKIRYRYLDYVCSRWANLELRGVMQTGKSEAVPLDEVYVALSAEYERHADSLLVETDAETLESQTLVQRGGRLNPLPEGARRGQAAFPQPVIRLERVELAQALRENPRLVVLGDPGSGKTTLARFVVRQFALACRDNKPRVLVETPHAVDGELVNRDDYGEPRLPLLVRVADYAEAWKRDRSLLLRDFLITTLGEANIAHADATVLIQDALTSGSAMIVLDGMDEVAEAAGRSAVARRIDDFVHGAGASSRILVTSRIAGYASAPLNSGFASFTIRDMDEVQIQRFVSRRVLAYERVQTPDLSESLVVSRAKREIDSILDAVRRNAGVRRLAVNPLLLTILCLIHRTGARLPERRVDLYEMASKTLLEDWRPAQTEQEDCLVRMSEADRLLAPLADWMHEHTERGHIQSDKARKLLLGFCAEKYGLPTDHPKIEAEVENFWQRITYDTSVFVERSPGEYAFLHLTFQEYWAARHLVRDYRLVANHLRARRHQARFQEVILLAIASQTEENASNYIRAAIWCPSNQAEEWGYVPSPYEDILRRDLLLAVRCMADCTGTDPALVREAVQEITAICLMQNRLPIDALRQKVLDTLREVGDSIVCNQVCVALLAALKDGTTSDVQYHAAKALGTVGVGSEAAREALLAALENGDSDVQSEAASALGKVGVGSDAALKALLAALKDGNSYAAFALGKVGVGSDAALKALLAALKDGNSYAARALGTVGVGSEAALEALLAALENGDPFVQSQAAFALGKVGVGSDAALKALLAALKDGNSIVQYHAALALGKVGVGSDAALKALLAALKDGNSIVQYHAALALGTVGVGSDAAREALLAALKDGNSIVQYHAALALGTVGVGSDAAREALLAALENGDSDVQSEAASALGTVGVGSEAAREALIAALKDGNSYAASALGTVGVGSEPAREALIAALRGGNSGAAFALGTVGVGSEAAREALLAALENGEPYVRSAAWEAISNIVGK